MDCITKNLLEVSIVVDGDRLPIHEHGGRYYVAGEAGRTYVIRVRNCGIYMGTGRIEVLESVDGRNVLQDEAASFRNQGMVFTGTWDNRGWRINDQEVREFKFGSPEASIAAQATGSAANVGVIGVAVFVEKVYTQRPGFYSRSPRNWGDAMLDKFGLEGSITVKSMSSSRGSYAGGQSVPADLGTGMGEIHADSVGRTTFQRATNIPAEIIEIQYRSRGWLVEQGVIGPVYPSAFPADDTGYSQYAK